MTKQNKQTEKRPSLPQVRPVEELEDFLGGNRQYSLSKIQKHMVVLFTEARRRGKRRRWWIGTAPV